ncbi:MAG: glycerate kinase [Bacilli bacterium]|nr:glycerate kinase [Bacilli bacterium]
MKVLGLIDSFKGSLSSIQIGKILEKELKAKNIELDYFPVSDGGEGFLDALINIKSLEKIYAYSVDPLNRKIRPYFLYDKSTDTAYIELAKTAGLNLLKKNEYNPFKTTTFGCGLLIKNAIAKNIKNIVIGIGGSCTNDGGSGILAALGVKFYDQDDKQIDYLCNDSLKYIRRIDANEFFENVKGVNIKIVSDVQNELLGENGASFVYAPQKGAKFDDLPLLDANMANYSNLVEKLIGARFSNLPASGAAGGVGFAFLSMFSAALIKGIDYILNLIEFDKIKNNYDFILTGEGKIDKQSLAGKVVFEIVKRSYPVKTIVVCAINELEMSILKNLGVYNVYSIVDSIATEEKSLSNPRMYFRKLVKNIEFK